MYHCAGSGLRKLFIAQSASPTIYHFVRLSVSTSTVCQYHSKTENQINLKL